MENKELEQAAKDFCESIQIGDEFTVPCTEMGVGAKLSGKELLAKFAQYLLDTGEMVEAKEFDDLHVFYEKYRSLALDKSNTPQSGEVKTMLDCLNEVSQNNGHGYVNWPHACREADVLHLNDIPQKAGKMYANQFKTPAYDLLLASYNTLKAEDNKKALEINRLMSGQKVVSDKELDKKASEITEDMFNPNISKEAVLKMGVWVRDQLNKQ